MMPTRPSERGRRKRRVLSHTHSLMCESEKAHELQSPQVWPVQSGVSCAIGFNGFLRALPGDRAFLSPLQVAMREHRHLRDASVEASEPHDFAVREIRHSSVDGVASIASRTLRS